jgi:hypothetical protein
MGDAGDGLSVTDGQDRGETGPGGSDRGAREKEREIERKRERERDGVAVGHRHVGPGDIVSGGVFQTGFETKIRTQMVQNIFKPFQTLVN